MESTRWAVALVALALGTSAAAAEPWSPARIRRLPDSAFTVVESTPDGRMRCHLLHHDETGAVDPAHFGPVRARLGQALDPPGLPANGSREGHLIPGPHLHERQLCPLGPDSIWKDAPPAALPAVQSTAVTGAASTRELTRTVSFPP